MNKRVAAQVSLGLIVLALVSGVGRPTRTLAAGTPGNAGELILGT